jgi:hypothetical protein
VARHCLAISRGHHGWIPVSRAEYCGGVFMQSPIFFLFLYSDSDEITPQKMKLAVDIFLFHDTPFTEIWSSLVSLVFQVKAALIPRAHS